MLFNCGVELTEDERFDKFATKYEKTVEKFFPKKQENRNADIESLISKDIPESELLRKAEFCRKNINQLASFEIENLTAENAAEYEQIFNQLKKQLQEVSAAAE